ncbi:hypothetical protein NL676_020182 [Syzygium grande]|nr:hypothetical protein NL676_020182 [Syzygium grande]
MALPFRPQCLHSHHAFLTHHIVRTKAFLPSSSNNHRLLPVVASRGSVLAHKPFSSRSVFSRKKKKKKNRSGSRRFARLVLNLIPIIASNLKAPPRQLQLIAEELGAAEMGAGEGQGGSGEAALGGDGSTAGGEAEGGGSSGFGRSWWRADWACCLWAAKRRALRFAGFWVWACLGSA